MRLAELAFACYVYGPMSDYDSSYLQFLQKTKPQLDLSKPNHRMALLKWLNDWKCRQFARRYHDLASEEIRLWFEEVRNQLLPLDKTLLTFSSNDFAFVKNAYKELLHRTASIRTLLNGDQSKVEFGPTGTSKILFALRPNSMIPWDEAMRAKFQLAGSEGDYVKFLKIVKKDIEELDNTCNRSGYKLSDLPQLLGRPKFSLTKLIDEYHWVTITRNCSVPTSKLLMQWAQWW